MWFIWYALLVALFYFQGKVCSTMWFQVAPDMYNMFLYFARSIKAVAFSILVGRGIIGCCLVGVHWQIPVCRSTRTNAYVAVVAACGMRCTAPLVSLWLRANRCMNSATNLFDSRLPPHLSVTLPKEWCIAFPIYDTWFAVYWCPSLLRFHS